MEQTNIWCQLVVNNDTLKGEGVAGRFESTEVYSRMYLRNPRLDTSSSSTYTYIILNDLSNVLSNENREDLHYEKWEILSWTKKEGYRIDKTYY